MFYVYFLKSLVNDDLYVGSCENLEKRLIKHNSQKVKSTKGYAPWKLIGSEKYKTRSEAVQKERFYKTGQQKEILKKRYN